MEDTAGMASPALITGATGRMGPEGSKVGGGVPPNLRSSRGGAAGKTASDGEGNRGATAWSRRCQRRAAPAGQEPTEQPGGSKAWACGVCTAHVSGDGAESGPRDDLRPCQLADLRWGGARAGKEAVELILPISWPARGSGSVGYPAGRHSPQRSCPPSTEM